MTKEKKDAADEVRDGKRIEDPKLKNVVGGVNHPLREDLETARLQTVQIKKRPVPKK